MKLRFLRFLETIFSTPAAFFGDLADALHDKVWKAMQGIKRRELISVTYGDNSRHMWNQINGLRETLPQVWEALYTMGVKMQELERKVERLDKCKRSKRP